MQFRVESEESARLFRVRGELDMLTVNDLLQAVGPYVATGSGDLRIDLSELSFMDSTGLVALLDLSSELDGRGRLVLLSPTRSVARLLELARAETIPNIAIVPTAISAA